MLDGAAMPERPVAFRLSAATFSAATALWRHLAQGYISAAPLELAGLALIHMGAP
jgi:hypothetical protein